MEALQDELLNVLLDEQPASLVYYRPLQDNRACGSSDFQIVYCNKAAALLANSTTHRVIGTTVSRSADMSNTARADLLHQLRHVYKTGETVYEECYNPGADRYYHITHNKVGHGVLTTSRDVTESVLLRKEKERQSELASRILHNALNGWFYCEAIRNEKGKIIDFKFVMINPAFTRMVRKKEKDVIGKTHLSLFPIARNNGLHELNCRVVNEKEIIRKQMYYEGDELDAWYDVVASPLGENGLLVTFADITHLKQKEMEAAQLAETLTTVINTVQVGIFTLKPFYDTSGKIVDFRFTMVNPALSSYVAQEPETLVGALGSEWFPGYLTNGVFDMYNETYTTGETQRRQFHYDVDGIDVYLDLQSTKIGEEVLVTFSDFTPLQLAQLELQKSIRELERSNQNMEEFTRAASHDLKEPVRKIQIFAGRVKSVLDKHMSDETRDLFTRMENAASRMQMLIDDLLEYSYVNSKEQVTECVDLNEIITQVIFDLEIMIDETGTVIEFEPLPEITGNRRQIQQVLLNLVNNSIKYRKKGINPHIFIHSREIMGSDAEVEVTMADLNKVFFEVEIADNGIGFDQIDSNKIFNVFTRLHKKADYAGTGIGLAIASKVMENHSGYIFARGVKGQGAAFTLLFPKS